MKRWVKRFGWVSDERPCCMKFNSLDVEARSDDPGPPPLLSKKKEKKRETHPHIREIEGSYGSSWVSGV